MDPEALAVANLEGIHRYFEARTSELRAARESRWIRDLSSPEAYAESVQEKRDELAALLGVPTDSRPGTVEMQLPTTTSRGSLLAETDAVAIHAVRWEALAGIHAEGLLLAPKGRVRARVVGLVDADEFPETAAGLAPAAGATGPAWALDLAEGGALVLLPTLVSRDTTFSGNELVGRRTNQPHREWLHRQTYQLGRHLVGIELQKVFAAVDWFVAESGAEEGDSPVGVVGYGEGGLLALHAAALDSRIDAALVSGHFGPREDLHAEPIYRNIWRLLVDFGDAEIASLVAPRILVVDPAAPPAVEGPPEPAEGQVGGAAPGSVPRPSSGEVLAELERARKLVGPEIGAALRWIEPAVDESAATGPSGAALAEFAAALGLALGADPAAGRGRLPADRFDPDAAQARQARQIGEIETFVRRLVGLSAFERDASFWAPMREALSARTDEPPAEVWEAAVVPHRERFHRELLGKLPEPSLPPNARIRLLERGEGWTAYLVVLDVWPEVQSWGYLILPEGLSPGERRPAVVVQHGLGGSPRSAIDPASNAYRAFGARLAARGFVVYAPYNPNALGGAIRFRQIQRRANPLGASIFSVIVAQHRRVLEWLGAQDFVDPARIGFYGLSYGGKTAMRVPSVLPGYALSICSGDFNQWVRKITEPRATTRVGAGSQRFSSYLYTSEYEIMEFDQGNTFDYAEMAALVSPRPFMVERGHRDLVASDEWVAYEYAAVRRHYADLGIPGRTESEFFDEGHVIRGEGSFRFLHRHLDWPEP